MLEIKQFKNNRGEGVIDIFFADLAAKHQGEVIAKIIADLELLLQVEWKNALKSRLVVKMQACSNIFELRTSWRGNCYRLLFTIYLNNYYFLSAFTKKSQKTELKELNKAKKRQTNLLK